MEILLLIIGIIIGTVVGYLAADRKSAALKAEISGTKKEIELLKLQKEEAEALHKRMNIEFENLSNRIFQSKAEDFTKLNAEHLGNLLRPLGDNLKDFRQKVEPSIQHRSQRTFLAGRTHQGTGGAEQPPQRRCQQLDPCPERRLQNARQLGRNDSGTSVASLRTD